jgi:hypothetical protein
MKKRRSRHVELRVEFDKARSVTDIVIDHETGRIVILDGDNVVTPKAVHVQAAYERPKGDKVLVRTPLDPRVLVVTPEVALTGFDRLVAIDTNTKHRADGEIISITAIIGWDVKPLETEGRGDGDTAHPLCP